MWVNKKPEYGNQIRVNRGLYYHHGVYESDTNTQSTLNTNYGNYETSFAEAQANQMAGMAEAAVMQAKGYNQKDVLQADVQKAYAEGIDVHLVYLKATKSIIF